MSEGQKKAKNTAKKKLARKEKFRKMRNKALLYLISVGIIFGAGYTLGKNEDAVEEFLSNNQIDETSADTSHTTETSQEIEDTYEGYYAGVKYEFISREYAMELAEKAIANANEVLKDVEIRGGKKGCADFIDKYYLMGLAYQETNFRVKNLETGAVVVSPVGCLGVCQIDPDQSMIDVNNLLTRCGVNYQYTKEDLKDPQKSFEICALYLNICAKGVPSYYGEYLTKHIALSKYNMGITIIGDMNRSEYEAKYLNTGSYADKSLNFANMFEEKMSDKEEFSK